MKLEMHLSIFNLCIKLYKSLPISITFLVSRVNKDDSFLLVFLALSVKLFDRLFRFARCNSCIKTNLSDEELSVAEFANFSARLLSISVDSTPWIHSFLNETILAVVMATKLTEVHLGALLEDKVSAAGTGPCLYLFFLWAIKEEDCVLVI